MSVADLSRIVFVFVGHALLAFAIAALVADWRGWPTRRALGVGALAGAFAATPDVDVIYAVVGVVRWGFDGGVIEASNSFWTASTEVHRSMTHSIVVGVPAGVAFGLWTVRGRRATVARALAGATLATLVGTAFVVSGPLGALVVGLFVLAGVGVATVARRETTVDPRVVAVAAVFGLLSHPWGDLVTGDPPRLLYPLGERAFESRVELHADQTLHLLGAFAVELAVVWVAVGTFLYVTGRPLGPLADRRWGLGTSYGVAAFVFAPPTLDVSYHFVFSILAIGLVCGGSQVRPSSVVDDTIYRLASDPEPALRTVVTSLAAITAALVGYTAVYVVAVAP